MNLETIMKPQILFLSLTVMLAVNAPAASRSSARYNVPADTVDCGGRRTTSARYANDGSVGGLFGVSAAGAPLRMAKHGYAGQLYDVTNFVVSASPSTVNEGATRQLNATALADDGSSLAPSSVAWSVVSGPIASINASGLATAGIVYQNTPATVRGTAGGRSGQADLQVVNVNTDNFGTYAGDGLDDVWQVQYFGIGSPNARPGVDPDGDGQTNRFEYIAGTIPTDAASRFRLAVNNVPGQPTRKAITFSPRFPSRTYTVEMRTNVAVGTIGSLAGSTTLDTGTIRTVTDLNATNASRFYRVNIAFP